MNRVLSTEELLVHWEAEGRPRKVVFTNGCFDLLHPGHVRYLTAARGLGDCLVVGLNDDAGVSRLKGPYRPYLTLAVRAELLAALEAVDYVVPFSEDTPLELVKRLRPDVLVKGGGYEKDMIVGGQEVVSWGGEVVVLPLEDDFSTTAMALAIGDSTNAEMEEDISAIFRPYGVGMGGRATKHKAKRDKRIHRAGGRRGRK
ncbi:MAG TPA: D-glycero-beta-D-manno-heptose 1-phosphate adenylyltransferase [bacterium]|nr:D-glycero-beta-D-manno-heptose 1-phosphate adenylyltransferase [bacterium]